MGAVIPTGAADPCSPDRTGRFYPAGMGNARRWVFAMAALFLAPLFLAHPAAAAGGLCRVDDLMPAYFAFADRTQGQPPSERARAFAAHFAPLHRAFYDPEAFGTEAKLRKTALKGLDPARPLSLAGFGTLKPAHFRALGRGIGAAFEKAEQRFKTQFPDFRCDLYVGFGPSFLRFDGHGFTAADGTKRMLFGVDTIALLHDEKDMPAFFAHELFHIHHAQVMGAALPKPDDLVWWSLWEEGLATYVSQRMHPELDAQSVLWFPKDLVARMQGQERDAARGLLADIDRTGDAYGRWFTSGESAPGFPPRAGYYIGYLFARDAGEGKPLSALTNIPPSQVRQMARAFLTHLAQCGVMRERVPRYCAGP